MAIAGGPIPSAAGAPVAYYGQPIVKAPVWTWQVGLYFFVGGTAGMSGVLALAGLLTGQPLAFVRTALAVAFAGALISPALLIADLGRPARFFNMMRVFKWRSAMASDADRLQQLASAALCWWSRIRCSARGVPVTRYAYSFRGRGHRPPSAPCWPPTPRAARRHRRPVWSAPPPAAVPLRDRRRLGLGDPSWPASEWRRCRRSAAASPPSSRAVAGSSSGAATRRPALVRTRAARPRTAVVHRAGTFVRWLGPAAATASCSAPCSAGRLAGRGAHPRDPEETRRQRDARD